MSRRGTMAREVVIAGGSPASQEALIGLAAGNSNP